MKPSRQSSKSDRPKSHKTSSCLHPWKWMNKAYPDPSQPSELKMFELFSINFLILIIFESTFYCWFRHIWHNLLMVRLSLNPCSYSDLPNMFIFMAHFQRICLKTLQSSPREVFYSILWPGRWARKNSHLYHRYFKFYFLLITCGKRKGDLQEHLKNFGWNLA